MSDYGYHPTPYEHEPDESFYAHFREIEWSKADEATKQNLLQEAVNRAAEAHGEQGAPLVVFKDLPSYVSGNQNNGIIRMNRDRYVDGVIRREVDGQVYEIPIQANNILALETALHENEHAYQDQINDGTILPQDLDLAREYGANGFDLSAVNVNGQLDVGQQYLTGDGSDPRSYYAYYTQPTERDAYKLSEARTMEIVNKLEAMYGTEDSFQIYRDNVNVNGFNANITKAQEVFQDNDVVNNVSATLQNAYYKGEEELPVTSHDTESFVLSEMQASYQDTYMGGRVEETQGQEDGTNVIDNDQGMDM
ncbi:MAG: hypothetical protein J6P61_03510 [Erysipelotrichaceae bacterium]|nr:hypothetical protein [Erysipelotrichaceae bacterium]